LIFKEQFADYDASMVCIVQTFSKPCQVLLTIL
jgi:hypothetical protein